MRPVRLIAWVFLAAWVGTLAPWGEASGRPFRPGMLTLPWMDHPSGAYDFVSAWNAHLSQDVTPETNAAVLLTQALGPKVRGKAFPPDYYRRLGIAPPVPRGPYFLNESHYVMALVPRNDLDRQEREHHLRAMYRYFSITPWTPADSDDFIDLLFLNTEPIERACQASRRPHYYEPIVPGKSPTPWSLYDCSSHADEVLSLGTMLCVRAMLATGMGEREQAWDDLMAAARLARLLDRGGSWEHDLYARLLEEQVHPTMIAFLQASESEGGALTRYQAEWAALPARRSRASWLDGPHRILLLDLLQQKQLRDPEVFHGHDLADYPYFRALGKLRFDIPTAMRRLNQHLDTVCRACETPNPAERNAAILSQREAKERLYQRCWHNRARVVEALFETPERRAEEMADQLAQHPWVSIERQFDVDQRLVQSGHVVAVVFALERHHRAEGRYPERLGDLVPRWLAAVPTHPQVREPWKYVRVGEGYRLHNTEAPLEPIDRAAPRR